MFTKLVAVKLSRYVLSTGSTANFDSIGSGEPLMYFSIIFCLCCSELQTTIASPLSSNFGRPALPAI